METTALLASNGQNLRYSAEMEQFEANTKTNAPNMHNSADSRVNLANSIRLRRRVLGLTQEDLSDISGVSTRLIHELEHGKESVRLGNLIKILSSMGMHLEITLGASDYVTIDPTVGPLIRAST